MNDLFNRIFLKVCLHAAVTFATIVVWHILPAMSSYDSLWVCIFITNCTTLIICKLNQILERLPGDDEQQNTD